MWRDTEIKTDDGVIIAISGDGRRAIERVSVPGGDVMREIDYAGHGEIVADEYHRYEVVYMSPSGPEPPGLLAGFTETGMAEVLYPSRTVMRHAYVNGSMKPVATQRPAETVFIRLDSKFIVREADGLYEKARRELANFKGKDIVLWQGANTLIWLERQGKSVILCKRSVEDSQIKVSKAKFADRDAIVMTVAGYNAWRDGSVGLSDA